MRHDKIDFCPEAWIYTCGAKAVAVNQRYETVLHDVSLISYVVRASVKYYVL
jgi:hypothetical protein